MSSSNGKYEIAKDDYFLFEVKEDKLYFTDRGSSTEILPEAENKFYIHFPGEITFTFEIDESGKVIGMEANFNGYKMKTKKI